MMTTIRMIEYLLGTYCLVLNRPLNATGDYTSWWRHQMEPNPVVTFFHSLNNGLWRNFDSLTEFTDLLYAVQRLLRDIEDYTPLPPPPLPPGDEVRETLSLPVLNIIT